MSCSSSSRSSVCSDMRVPPARKQSCVVRYASVLKSSNGEAAEKIGEFANVCLLRNHVRFYCATEFDLVVGHGKFYSWQSSLSRLPYFNDQECSQENEEGNCRLIFSWLRR